MQNLTYVFILAISVALGVTGFFGLQLTVIQSVLLGLVVLALCLFLAESSQRRRAHERLERSVQDLSRLLSTNAQAGQSLSKRLSTLEDLDAKSRLDVVEADLSVLGTVVRQLAETVSDLEDQQGHTRFSAKQVETEEEPAKQPPDEDLLEPVIPVEMLRQAIAEGRLLYYVQPIVTLPQRKTHGYDIIPHLQLEDGEVCGPEDFMPRSGYGDIVREIENGAMQQAIAFARRSRTAQMPSHVYVPMSTASLGNAAALHQLAAQFDANRAVIEDLSILVSEPDWKELTVLENKALEALAKKGASFSLYDLPSLRLTYASLADLGVTSVRAIAKRLVNDPESYTDLHTADLTPYLKRFEIDLIVTNTASEQQILTCIDDGVKLVTGPHIARPGPMREDLAGPTTTRPRTATLN